MVNPPPPTILCAEARDFLEQFNGGSLHPKLATSTEKKRSGVLKIWNQFCLTADHADLVDTPYFLQNSVNSTTFNNN
jgi:hypothetical protein